MVSLLNLGSLVLGLVAWGLPIVNLTSKKQDQRNWGILSLLSFSACAISLCLQILYSYHLVKIEDWSALMDITWSTAVAAVVLVIVTIILNVMTLVVYRARTTR